MSTAEYMLLFTEIYHTCDTKFACNEHEHRTAETREIQTKWIEALPNIKKSKMIVILNFM